MNPTKLDGKKVASEMESNLTADVSLFKRMHDEVPHLAIFLVGSNPASIKYTQMKALAAKRTGMRSININLATYSTPESILDVIGSYNRAGDVHGIMLQHPVPEHLMPYERDFFDLISPIKDVDGLSTLSFGKLSVGSPDSWRENFHPATARGIMSLLNYYHIDLRGITVTIIGSSPILGLPLSMLLHRAGATVCIANIDSKPGHIRNLCQMSDMVVGACGVPGIVTPDMVKEGVILIDAGWSPGNIGDIDPTCYEKSSFYTPLPGGVGPMTTISLLIQTMQAAKELKRESNRGRPVGGTT